ncbi:alpha/beta fold hydrolase [Levilactobacillus namurensis]|uniref:alpha/beta fold hydrolase n=1 Tax=Levilactobacillus namurensis TaxID=380393 RepID=UPI000465917D|nr:alpha/beta hydrolase [Levilactobacillus namurensis]
MLKTYHRAGLRLTYHEFGTGDPIVLLHGFPEDGQSWHTVSQQLVAAEYRTIIPEMRGYTPQASPAARTAYRTDHLAADIIGLLDTLQLQRVHLVGHDWGGQLAWKIAQWYPQRIKQLTVVATPHPKAMLWAYRHSTQLFRSAYVGLFQVPQLPERVVAQYLRRFLRCSGLNATEASRLSQKFQRPAKLTGPLNWYRALFLRDQPATPDDQIHVPTVFVWGQHDAFLGAAAAEKTADFIAAPYHFMVVNGGHWLPEERPELVAHAILMRH